MQKLALNDGSYALVDDQDYDACMQYSWYATMSGSQTVRYAITNFRVSVGKFRTLRLHRFIADRMGLNLDKQIDHIDTNGLNCRRNNLRTANPGQNSRNKKRAKNNTSGYKGVSFSQQQNKWLARITYNNKTYHLGLFDTKEAAANAYQQAAQKLHKEYMRLT